MNILLWILQVLFALHTAAGGLWKFSNATATVPSLMAIPHPLWLLIGLLDLLAAIGLIVPIFNKSWGKLVGWAALYVVFEMLVFMVIHISSGASGDAARGELVYWGVVALVGAFIAWGRLVKRPL